MICQKHLNEMPAPILMAAECKAELQNLGYIFNQNDDPIITPPNTPLPTSYATVK